MRAVTRVARLARAGRVPGPTLTARALFEVERDQAKARGDEAALTLATRALRVLDTFRLSEQQSQRLLVTFTRELRDRRQ